MGSVADVRDQLAAYEAVGFDPVIFGPPTYDSMGIDQRLRCGGTNSPQFR